MSYDRHKPFVPTVENPGPVSFSGVGTYWTIRRDEFTYWDDAGLQALVTRWGPSGAELPPQTVYLDGPAPPLA